MYFPISNVTINPLLLVGIGFIVGILGGFFGVGGGFLAGPLLFWTGVPINIVVGTDLAHMTGKSIVAAKRHRTLGHVDLKLGAIMVAGTIVGVEAGAQLIELLEFTGQIELVVGLSYIVILSVISAFTAWESIRALKMIRAEQMDVRDALAFGSITHRVHSINLRPMVNFPGSGIDSVSVWVVLAVGFVGGLFAGFLGVGGGFVRMPLLVYLVGVPTHVAVGTDLFEIVISAGFGTVTHALKGNVDIFVALVMHTGAAIGAQIGAVSTRFFVGPRIRLLFSVLPLVGAILVFIRLISGAEVP